MGKTVSIFNQKGGVGKTTTCVNFAAALGLKGKKTLLVDLDPQGNTTSGVGIDKTEIEKSTYDILINDEAAKDIVIKTEFKNLSVLPANMNLAGAELELAEEENRFKALKKALAPLVMEYDYIIIDCPPSLGLLSLNALTASDTLIVPLQCEYYALEGLSQLLGRSEQLNSIITSIWSLKVCFILCMTHVLSLIRRLLMKLISIFRIKRIKQLFHEALSLPKHRVLANLSFIMKNTQSPHLHIKNLQMNF